MFKGIIDANTQDEPQEIFTIGTDVEAETGGTLAKNNFFIRDEYSSNNPVRLFISSDGNVGIGTTSPSAQLDVAGTTNLNGDVSVVGAITAGTINGGTLDVGSITAGTIHFPDGSVQTSAAMGTNSRNPMQIALLRWYEDNETEATSWPSFNVGNNPISVAFDGANIWVTNYFSNTVTKLSASDGGVLGTFNVGAYPHGVAFDGANIWVTNEADDTVTKLRASDGNLQGTFNVGDGPNWVAFDGANIWVTNYLSGTLSKL